MTITPDPTTITDASAARADEQAWHDALVRNADAVMLPPVTDDFLPNR